jgi:hypothetical protein
MKSARTVKNLVAFMNAATQRVAATSLQARSSDLASALARLANSHGISDPTKAGEELNRKILRAIERQKSDKLRNWSYETKTLRPWKRKAQVLPLRWATMLVRLKHREQTVGRLRGAKRFNREAEIENASCVTLDKLIPVEKRAVELLRGDKRKPRKNVIEERAIVLEQAVRADWLDNTQNRGRPKGASSHNIKTVGCRYEVPLSIAEVISLVRPLIENFAGRRIKASVSDAGDVEEIKSPTFAALVAAVRIALPDCPAESILSTMGRENRKMRASKPRASNKLIKIGNL